MWYAISLALAATFLGHTAFAAGLKVLGIFVIVTGVSGWVFVYIGYAAAAKIALALALAGVITSHVCMWRRRLGPFAPRT